MRAVLLATGLAAALAGGLAAQDPAADRLAGRVPPDVAAAVADLASRARERGLPVEPLIQKALEGGAKGVPAPRVTAAVAALLERLGAAQAALRAGGIGAPSPGAIEAGAYALAAGFGEPEITALARIVPPAQDAAVALQVAGTLAALGVPAAETVALVTQYVRTGRSPVELMSLPAQVQQSMARGATPAQAAAGLARAAAARQGPPRPVPPGRRPDPPRP